MINLNTVISSVHQLESVYQPTWHFNNSYFVLILCRS